MTNSSECTVVGNLTADPELRYTNTGRAVASFGIAVNRRWQDRTTNEWQEQTSFFNVSAWATLGENVAASVRKGDRVVVNGRIEQRTYEVPSDPPGGEPQRRQAFDIIADEVCPSLRFATATVTKNPREGANGAPPATPDGESLVPAGAPAVPMDEEPF